MNINPNHVRDSEEAIKNSKFKIGERVYYRKRGDSLSTVVIVSRICYGLFFKGKIEVEFPFEGCRLVLIDDLEQIPTKAKEPDCTLIPKQDAYNSLIKYAKHEIEILLENPNCSNTSSDPIKYINKNPELKMMHDYIVQPSFHDAEEILKRVIGETGCDEAYHQDDVMFVHKMEVLQDVLKLMQEAKPSEKQ